jgi:[citrate (pro-3S)-lyase] ligase
MQKIVNPIYFNELSQLQGNSVILYGAGAEGRRIINWLRSKNITPSYFCDFSANKIGLNYCGLDVIPISDLKQMKESKKIIITINRDRLSEISKFLLSKGIEDELYYIDNSPFYSLGGKIHIIDEHAWTRSDPWHLTLSYSGIKKYSKKYFNEIKDNNISFYMKNRGFYANDKKSRYVNAKNGMRVTTDNPSVFDSSIYICGSSVAYGCDNEDRYTISSFLQRALNKSPLISDKIYRVLNRGIYAYPFDLNVCDIKNQKIHRGDLIFLVYGNYLVSTNEINRPFSPEESLNIFLYYLNDLKCFCQGIGAYFVFCLQTSVYDVQDPSPVEVFLARECVFHNNPMFKICDFPKEKMIERLKADEVSFIEFSEHIQRPHKYQEIFVDRTHVSPNGNRLMANVIYEKAGEILKSDNYATHPEPLQQENIRSLVDLYEARSRKYTDTNISHFSDGVVDRFKSKFAKYAEKNKGNNGCIVVNCNPFTNGHRFLIETALEMVDFLYIFVIEANKSIFPFKERFALVKKGVFDLKNVAVLKSESLIISSITFPSYFEKDALSDKTVDCTLDLDVFGKIVAPTLSIKKRFIGTEPYCKVTAQYNKQMKKLLPFYNIEVIEIERISIDNMAVSASRVRDFVRRHDFEALRKLVPQTTFDHIIALKGK